MTQTDSPHVAPVRDTAAAGCGATNPSFFEAFRNARSRARGPIVCVDADALLINGPRRVSSRTTTIVNCGVGRGVRSTPTTDRSTRCPLLWRQLQARCEAISTDGLRSAALIHIVGRGDGERHGRRRASRVTVGWSSLRESERGIAELVAAGLTNREIGDRLYLSRHTVDAHLRQIFRKLDIRSRVELTRMVVEHAAPGTRA